MFPPAASPPPPPVLLAPMGGRASDSAHIAAVPVVQPPLLAGFAKRAALLTHLQRGLHSLPHPHGRQQPITHPPWAVKDPDRWPADLLTADLLTAEKRLI